MAEIVLEIKQLSKFYQQKKRRGNNNFREAVMHWWKDPFRRQDPRSEPMIPAVKAVSFALEKGDILGIVGRNGAGKSTILKILAGVIQPTAGEVIYKGKLASILELGAGFHPDLTGTENVYLNGALLGMPRSSIADKMEDIVEFSELGAFIHQPVKHYSNGMYLRLAFSIFAYLEADILLMDEVISVGDLPFQQKCYNQITKLANAGMTIILVSHNPDQIKELCNKCLWIEQGEAKALGTPSTVVDQYLEKFLMANNLPSSDSSFILENNCVIWSSGFRIKDEITIFRYGLKAKSKPPSATILISDDLEIEIEFEKLNSNLPVEITISILSLHGAWVFVDSYGMYAAFENAVKQKGRYQCKCVIPAGILNFGIYQLGFLISRAEEMIWQNPGLFNFKINFQDKDGVKNYLAREAGSIIRPLGIWEVSKLAD